jgi:hypothetical protein
MPTFASNFMLDGFAFSEEYGEGPLVNNKNTTTSRTTGMAPAPRSESGMAKLPDGIVTADTSDDMGWDVFAGGANSDIGDLSDLIKTANHLTDLSWLEVVEQDPDRLPHHHNDAVIQGLVDAWGTNSRTNGVDLVPNVVVPPQPRSPVAQLPGDQYREVVASAMRKSAFGAPFENIVAGVAAHLGEAMSHVHTDPRLQKLAQSLRSVKAEHGVVGQLYLRDSAFPALLTGKWDKEIRKRCASAHYWLTKPGSKLSAYENYLGKKVVTEIPWREALAHYRPSLEASGRKVASGDPRRALLAAMASEPVRAPREATHTTHLAPADRVSIEEAWRVFASAPTPVREVVSKPAQGMTQEQATRHFARWVRAGLLPMKTARNILASGHTPEYKVEYGAWVIENPALAGLNTGTYDGTGVGVKPRNSKETLNSDWAKQEGARIAALAQVHAQRVAQERAAEADRVLAHLAKLSLKSQYQGDGVGASVYAGTIRKLGSGVVTVPREKALGVINGWVKSGSLTRDQAAEILSKKASGAEILVMGSDIILRAKKVAYEGPGVGVKTPTARVAAPAPPPRDPKVTQVLRYARTQMNNGEAGKGLDARLASKFSQDYLKGAGEQLVQLRRKHEGLAGHLYVDASAYASPTGTSGCDKGAALHRAGEIKALLQMERCGSCSQNTEGVCQKYNKTLVASAPVKDPAKYQRESIRLANADDSEHTAAMFNPEEFDLQNDSLDSIDLSNLPSGENLTGIKFEGMLIPEE